MERIQYQDAAGHTWTAVLDRYGIAGLYSGPARSDDGYELARPGATVPATEA